MADAVTSNVLLNGKRRYRIVLTNISDATGEAAVAKIVKSTLTNLNGVAPTKISIEKIQWSISGFTGVRLFWDHTVPDLIVALAPGVGGVLDFSPPLADPGSAGGTGNVTLTTVGAAAGATYTIEIWAIAGN